MRRNIPKFQHRGSTEYSYFRDWIKSQEGADAVMSKKQSLIKKPGGGYYKALEDGMYYPYEDDTGVVTIGFGRTNAAIKGLDILNDYSTGITVKEANDFLTTDIFNKFKDTKRKYNNRRRV